jgi:hypothetical protein
MGIQGFPDLIEQVGKDVVVGGLWDVAPYSVNVRHTSNMRLEWIHVPSSDGY